MKTYSAGEVAEATGASHATLRRYMRWHTPFQPCDGQSRGSGEKNRYSWRRLIQTGLTVACSQIGVAPSRGAKAAFEFSDKGNPRRAIGELFPLGTTYLVGFPSSENRVINVPPDLSIADVLSNDTAAFIVNVNNVIAKITEKLDSQ